MALDATNMASNRIAGGIKAAFIAVGGVDLPPDFKLTALSLALAAAIVNEFKDHAELVVTLPPDGTGTIK